MAITIQTDTTIDVVARQRALVQEALGQDGAYIRLKETLLDFYKDGTFKNNDGDKLVADTLASFVSGVTNNAMSVGLQWAAQEKDLELKKLELQYQLDILDSQKDKMEQDALGSEADKKLKQAQLLRIYGTPTTDADGDVVLLGDDGKEYVSIQNIMQDTNNKVKQGTALDAQTEQTYANTHKLVADTYVNHGVFTWTNLTQNGLAGVNKTSNGYVTLSDMNKEVAREQAKGYVYNAWAHGATAGASMLGTLAGAEIETIEGTTWTEMIDLWKNPTRALGNLSAPSISV